MRVLVTGATGRLGPLVADAAEAAGHEVRRLSSGVGRAGGTGGSGTGMLHGDLRTGEGLTAALEGVEALVHAATAPLADPWQVDVAGSRRLVEAVDRSSLRHLLYVSIVGVDRIPYGYYRAKFAAEQVLRASGLPVTVLRVTQFHAFVDDLLRQAHRGLLLPVPSGWRLQPVAVEEVTRHVTGLLAGSPLPGVSELAGPEVLDSVTLARTWSAAQPRPPRAVALHVPGRLGAAFRRGDAVPASGARGTVTYAEHLRTATQHVHPHRS